MIILIITSLVTDHNKEIARYSIVMKLKQMFREIFLIVEKFFCQNFYGNKASYCLYLQRQIGRRFSVAVSET